MGSRSSCGWWATTDVAGLADHFFRSEYGRVVGSLSRWLGPANLELAEDSVQEALASAVRTWPFRGIPKDPTGWLVRAARNHAVDVLRRAGRFDDLAGRIALPAGVVAEPPDAALALPDDQLNLMLLCCHPALRRPEQVALTLKAVAGFGTEEVARAFVLPIPTVAQRIVRAKRRIRDAQAELAPSTASEAANRIPAVLDVLYLIFNEGYSFGPEPGLRSDVAEEALRLIELLVAHPLGSRPDVHAMAALVLLQSSRFSARIDEHGAAVPLRDQDRARWDRGRIQRGLEHLDAAARGDRLTDIHLLAGIAACHATATGDDDTDWDRIVGLYDELASRGDRPLLRLNRAVAISMGQGSEAGLRLLDGPGLEGVPAHLIASARADCLQRLGRVEEAVSLWERAAAAAPSDAERLGCSREAARARGAADS